MVKSPYEQFMEDAGWSQTRGMTGSGCPEGRRGRSQPGAPGCIVPVCICLVYCVYDMQDATVRMCLHVNHSILCSTHHNTFVI